jgi:hypothetical protein
LSPDFASDLEPAGALGATVAVSVALAQAAGFCASVMRLQTYN